MNRINLLGFNISAQQIFESDPSNPGFECLRIWARTTWAPRFDPNLIAWWWPGGVILVAKKYQRWVHLSVQVHLYPWNFCTEKVQQQQLVASSSTGAIKASWEIDFIWSQLLTTFSLADIHCCTDSFYPVIETSLHTFTSSHGHHDHDKDLEFNFE